MANIIAKPIDTTSKILTPEIWPDVTRLTWFAKTIRPGSAIDIKKPNTNPAIKTIFMLLDFAKEVPVKSPKGVTPISTPNKKIVKPNTIRTEPSKNLIISILSKGQIVKFNTKTKILIGKTEKNTSLNLEIITFKKSPFHKASMYLFL